MDSNIREVNFTLEPRSMFSVPEGSTLEIRCLAGSLWITLDHDGRDIVIDAGGCFAVPPGRRAIVYALGESRVMLHDASACETSRPRAATTGPALRGVSAWLGRWMGAQGRGTPALGA